MTSKLIFTLLLSIVLAIGLVGYSTAAERYVNADENKGSNANDGGPDDPWLTITWALEQVSDTDAEPVTIHVAAGTYAGVSARAGVTQTVYISKTVAIRGGYTTANWTIPCRWWSHPDVGISNCCIYTA